MERGSEATPPGGDDPLFAAASLGEGLRLARERSDRSLAEMAALTRVHVRYLTAMEQDDHSALPSRVFALGYVRAYAMALGVDEQEATDRFKAETPDLTVPLQSPSGAAFQEMRRQSPLILSVIAVVVVAVFGWNVFQRISRIHDAQPSDIAETPASWAETADVPIRLSPANPAPLDQTVPQLYVTPGLEVQLTGVDPEDAAVAAAAAPAPPVQAAFNPRGAIYGASATQSAVIFQAGKPASLVLRRADGRVLFARQLAAGQAYRAPLDVAAAVDVSDPTAFDVYYNGELGPALTTPLTQLSGLNARAQTIARETLAHQAAEEAAAQIEAQRRAAEVARAAPPAPVPAPTQAAPA